MAVHEYSEGKESDLEAERLMEDDEEIIAFTDQGYGVGNQRTLRSRFLWLHSLLVAVNVLVFLALLWQVSWLTLNTRGSIRKYELESAHDSIQYEDAIFADSGFHERGHPPSIFEGPRNLEQDKAWMNLTTVGFVRLSAQQNAKLAVPTVESLTTPGEYPVALGVFHQLHCLNYLRIHLFPKKVHSEHLMARHDDSHKTGRLEDETMQEKHKSHCLDYLRQVIQCHGDMTPLSVIYNKDRSNYGFDHAVHHSCRNFDHIFSWAVDHRANIQIEG